MKAAMTVGRLWNLYRRSKDANPFHLCFNLAAMMIEKALPSSGRVAMKSQSLSAKQSKTRLGLSSYSVLLPRKREVANFMSRNTGLKKSLPEICAALRSFFGQGVELSLELYRDPEIDERYLTLLVRKDKYARGIMEEIERACAPVQQKLETLKGSLLITTDFSPPRGAHGNGMAGLS